MVGVVGIGKCSINEAVIGNGRRFGKPTLALSLDVCGNQSGLLLPLYKVKVDHQFQCLVQVLMHWLESSLKEFSSGNQSSSAHRNTVVLKGSLWPSPSKTVTGGEGYHLMYLNCVGSDAILGDDEVELEAYPRRMLMEIGRRFLYGKKLVVATIHVQSGSTL